MVVGTNKQEKTGAALFFSMNAGLATDERT
jgi:hypothetical protein